jgi:uncharacterized protein
VNGGVTKSNPAPTSASRSGASAPLSESLARVEETLAQLAEDLSVPRNVRKGAQAARDELAKPGVASDLRVASVVYLLDDLANDPNLPTHGRTAIWSMISSLESLQ